jgi:hypothetical protein
VSNDFTHTAVDQALRAELEGKVVRGVPIADFVRAAFPDTHKVILQNPLQNQREGYIAAVDVYLRNVEEAKERSQTYESFASLVNYVATARFAPIKMITMGRHSVQGVVVRK